MTDKNWEKETIGRYLTSILDPLVRQLLENLQGLTDLEDFREEIYNLLTEAAAQFMARLEAPSFDELSKYFRIAFCSYTTSFINADLPDGYPFLVAIIITQDGGNATFVVLKREIIQKKFVVLNKEAFPLFIIDTLEGDQLDLDSDQMRLIRYPEDLLALEGEI